MARSLPNRDWRRARVDKEQDLIGYRGSGYAAPDATWTNQGRVATNQWPAIMDMTDKLGHGTREFIHGPVADIGRFLALYNWAGAIPKAGPALQTGMFAGPLLGDWIVSEMEASPGSTSRSWQEYAQQYPNRTVPEPYTAGRQDLR